MASHGLAVGRRSMRCLLLLLCPAKVTVKPTDSEPLTRILATDSTYKNVPPPPPPPRRKELESRGTSLSRDAEMLKRAYTVR